MDSAYSDKLDGKIPKDFWEWKMGEWRSVEQQVKTDLNHLDSPETANRSLDAQKVFELANNARSLYISRDSTEKAELLRMLCSNYIVDAVSATPTYRKPFDKIFHTQNGSHIPPAWTALAGGCDHRTSGACDGP